MAVNQYIAVHAFHMCILILVGWLFYGVSTLFESFKLKFLKNQFSISIVFVYKQLNVKTVQLMPKQFHFKQFSLA